MKNFIIIITITASITMLFSCSGNSTTKKTEEHGHEGNNNHDDHENSNTVTLTAIQAKSIDIKLGNIEKKQLTASLKANGLLKVPNNNKANITALLGGVIQTIKVQTGNTVNKGQIIATIANNAFITMQEEFLTISCQLELAELEYQRQQKLQEGNAGILKKLQQTESKVKTLKAKKISLQKQLELIGINATSLTSENIQASINIISPINGVISEIMVNIGSYVDANNPIAQIVDNNQLHLDLYVYEKDLKKIKVGQTIHFTLTNNPGKEYDADVYAISNTFEQSTKAIAIHALVKGDKQNLIDGMSITALVSLNNSVVDAVPTNSIITYEGQDFIFVVAGEHTEKEHHQHKKETSTHQHEDPGHKHEEEHEGKPLKTNQPITFEKIPVKKGTRDIGYSEITLLKEIPLNSKIVINGAFFVLAKMNNKGEAHSH